ncbi:MAG TPA: DNA-processing protein DprA [Solirubrobacteraceae bacterium]|jgi:DNA processing protein|nr:DNA-processing protein DprA [Solirubrobacteraceae bacterium]
MSSGQRSHMCGACDACLRRGWLLSQLSGPLDFCARDRGRLLELLALEDEELLAAVAGRRTRELRDAYALVDASELCHEPRTQTICRHRRGYPRALRDMSAPRMLTVAGNGGRFAALTSAPVVAVVGSRAPSDYGRQMARSLARSLAASGVTVAASLADGIAAAALTGVLDAGGKAGSGGIAVLGNGLGISCSPRLRPLYKRVTRSGCAISELPRDCAGRRWGQLASERIVVGLASLTVVVEAAQTPADLAAAEIARALGRSVAAIPGRVTSPLSRGAHALLMDGARLVRGARDVLELLHIDGGEGAREPASPPARVRVEPLADGHPALRAVLERVGCGYDTPDKLARAGVDLAEVLPALGELELAGLLVRGDGGRYLPRDPLD